ncbi:MAG: glycosyltransferase, partial [Nocardioidaceae bacterium]
MPTTRSADAPRAPTRGPVVLISPVAPYPRDAGKKVVLAGLLEYWVDRLGADAVHYVHVGRAGEAPIQVPCHLHTVPGPRPSEQLVSLLVRTVVTGRHSLQESMLYAPRVARQLGEVLAGIGAELEIFDTIRMAQYAPRLPSTARRVVYLDDLFSLRYQRILAAMRDHPELDISPLGDFRQVIPAALGRIADDPHMRRVLLEVERRLIGRRERQMVEDFERCLLISHKEAAMLSAATGSGSVHTMSPVVDPVTRPRDYRRPPVFVLLGLLSLPHNHDAALTFLRSSMPRLRELVPDAVVHIVGRGATDQIRTAAAPYGRHVHIEDYVDDLGALLSSARAVLAPLRFGSGIKIKVLEALAHGTPVISTPVGAEGIATGEQYGVLVDDLARFPEVMHRVSDLPYNAMLSANALEHHRSTYSRSAAFDRYDVLFDPPPAQRPLRVCHVIHSVGPGGAEQVLVDLARAAEAGDFSMSVVSLVGPIDTEHGRSLSELGVPVRGIEMRSRWDPRVFGRARRVIESLAPDVVHSHLKHADLVGAVVSRRLGVPQVSTLHVIEEVRPGVALAKRWLVGTVRGRVAARTLAVSDAQRDWYLQHFPARPERVLTLHNGVLDPAQTVGGERAALRSELGAGSEDVVITMVALMRPGKGHDDLLAAIRLLSGEPSLHVVLVGDGPERPRLEALVAALPATGPRVTLVGYRTDVARLFGAADVVVLPSHSEALPTALIQALAAGVPVVATDVGGIPEVVGPDAGLLVPVGAP